MNPSVALAGLSGGRNAPCGCVFVDRPSGLVGEVSDLRLGNVMARARMILLFDRSEEHDALVLGTSNKTELLLGYGTLHGDLAAAINPLGDLYKTQVRLLADELGVPAAIRNKPPSADLWPDQTDEDDLMPVSQDFHSALSEMKVPHTWQVRPGGHTWTVWKSDLFSFSQQLFR